MITYNVPSSITFDEDQARSRMTLIQWASLADRLHDATIVQELNELPRFSRIKQSKTANFDSIKTYLRNGWATESLVWNNKDAFDGEALNNSLVWAYPQIYYSVFSIALGYFNAVGFTENKSHAALIRKFGDEVAIHHYPISISSHVNGGIKKQHIFTHCSKGSSIQGLSYDPTCKISRDSRIGSLLSATREIDLKERLPPLKLKTLSGKLKKRFSEEDYNAASRSEGVTTILSHLYRKRIKSNYRDIESILCPHLDANGVYIHILNIVNSFNLVHEGYIIQCVGLKAYDAIIQAESKSITAQPKKRLSTLRSIITKD